MQNKDTDLGVQSEDWERQSSEPKDLETEDGVGIDANIVINRGRVVSLNLYEVTEHELGMLETGSEATLQFNFAIFLFSITFACIIALVTCEFKWETVRSIFLFVCVLGMLLGPLLIISWLRSRKSVKNIILTIKGRIDEHSSQPTTP